MKFVIPDLKKPRRLLLFAGLVWVMSNLVVALSPDKINMTLWIWSFPILVIPYAFFVAWYIPATHPYYQADNWIVLPAHCAAWYTAGLLLLFFVRKDMGIFRFSTHLAPCIWDGVFLLFTGYPLFIVAYMILEISGIRRFPEHAYQCRHCGYNLTNNQSGNCPECGSTLDFYDRQLLERMKTLTENESEEENEES